MIQPTPEPSDYIFNPPGEQIMQQRSKVQATVLATMIAGLTASQVTQIKNWMNEVADRLAQLNGDDLAK